MNYNSLPKVPSIGSYTNNSSQKKSNSIQKNQIDSTKMNSSNTKNNNMINNNSMNNNKKRKELINQYSNSIKNKIKNTLSQTKISTAKSDITSSLKQASTNSYLYNMNYDYRNMNNINNINKNNVKLKSTNNKELINKLKNKSSALKFSITSKNYYINIKNNKNLNVNSFQLEEEPNDKNNKNIGQQDIAKGINILSKFDTFVHDIKNQQKDKNKFNKTSYNYYFDKSNNLKNTKSFDINYHKIEEANKNRAKKHIIIDTGKNKSMNKIEVDNNQENDKNKININNNIKNKNEKIDVKMNKDNIKDNNDISDIKIRDKDEKQIKINKKEKIKENNSIKKEEKQQKDKKNIDDNNILNNNLNKNENKIDKNISIQKKEEKDNKDIIEHKNIIKEEKIIEQLKEKEKENNNIIKKEKEIKESSKNEKVEKRKEKKTCEEEKEIEKENEKEKDKKSDEKPKDIEKGKTEEENKAKKDGKKAKEEEIYNSPIKKSKSKKKKKNCKNQPDIAPIIIQCKPLSPNHNNTLSKREDPEDLIPEYFSTSSINNIQIPKDYLNVIYYNLLTEEKENRKYFRAEYNYMNNQEEINEQMRSILIDWIIDVHGKFGFCDETLFMTISIIDRYSSIKKITRNEYQCLGITALMIACKHEEINVPKVEDFIYITDNAYNKSEVFNMEIDILDKLQYNLLYPSPIKFYEYLSLHFHFDKKMHYLGKYLMETFLLDLVSIKFKHSIISCACTYIVMKFFKMQNYKESYLKKWYMIEGKEGYEVENGCGVKDCATEMCNFVDNINNTNYLSCQKKYAVDEYYNISKLIVNYPENNNNTNNKTEGN